MELQKIIDIDIKKFDEGNGGELVSMIFTDESTVYQLAGRIIKEGRRVSRKGSAVKRYKLQANDKTTLRLVTKTPSDIPSGGIVLSQAAGNLNRSIFIGGSERYNTPCTRI